MKLVRPFTVTEAALTVSDVVETAPAAYNAGTTYALAATVSVATGTAIAVYESLQNSNTGNAPASSPSWWKLTGNTYALYSAGTSYAEDDIVISATTHRTYQSLVGSNLGNALTDVTKWTDIGPTNRWSMFDASVTSQTSNPESIEVTIQTAGRIDSVALLNVDAAGVTVTMTDSVEGEVYNETFSLVSPSGIIDWYAYFFEPIERLADLYIGDLPPYAGAEIEVSFDGAGATTKCGGLVLGLSKQIGETVYGAGVGIIDYSRKTVDAFGNFSIVERAFSKRANFTVNVPIGLTDQVQVLLSRYRAEPIIYVGADRFGSTLVYGFYKDFNVEIENPAFSVCTLQIEGLT
jgi:hypothetical protein